MESMTISYGSASFVAAFAAVCAAVSSLMQRFGASPIPAAQGTRVPAAAQLGHTTVAVDRKADDRVPPRGRRL